MIPRVLAPLVAVFVICLLGLLAGGEALAQTPSEASGKDLPESSKEMVLKELSALEAGQASLREHRMADAKAVVKNSLLSGPAAVDLIVDSLEKTRFRNQPLEFQEWRKKHQELLHNQAFEKAAQFQLRYLLMALSARDTPPPARIQETLAYLKAFQSSGLATPPQGIPPVQGSNDRTSRNSSASSQEIPQEALALLRTPLSRSAVVESMELEPYLPKEGFELTPGNAEGILEHNVREVLRSEKDPLLPETWDEQIRFESALLKTPEQQSLFQQQRLPELLGNKARDTAAIGQPNRALSRYMELIKGHPLHPDAAEWLKAAKELASKSSTPGSVPSASPSVAN